MKELKWSAILEGLIVTILGVLLICFPTASASVVCTLIGVGCLIGGLVCIINYCMIDVHDIFYRNDLAFGIFLILFGLLALYKKNVLAEILPIILGLVILISGLVKLQSASVAKRIGYQGANAYTVLGVISIVLGIIIMFFLPGSVATDTLFIVIGIGMVYSGISDLYVTFFLSSKYKKFIKRWKEKMETPKVIDAEVSDEHEEDDSSEQ
ncbi:MAG: DUF308 domain-containing protein [Lactimicrobium sp.]|jgi:uncharacterized membrane protein HdeD (DUF308 family)|uniref:HdeD family acid-resistance protein n=1 Tax=Lactimicrobium sp. TaxID=2563780 RepID=UPI002F3518E6